MALIKGKSHRFMARYDYTYPELKSAQPRITKEIEMIPREFAVHRSVRRTVADAKR